MNAAATYAYLLDDLNEAQRAAVSADLGHSLILAGAGSGKTRVLVHRIAWLLSVHHCSPMSILAVTFTNKAAREMQSRLSHILGDNFQTRAMWVGTFHGIAHRLLRSHFRDVGLTETFQILDSDDQHRLIKRIMRELQIDDSRWPSKQAMWYINSKKDEGCRAKQVQPQPDPYNKTMLSIYQAYEDLCLQNGLVDFAELLLRAYELWANHPEIRQHYQQRFQHVLVDEFQDTNTIQYAWLKLLMGEQNTCTAVGDDDQSIYGWRGARIENIHRFKNEFKQSTVYRLEQNYRSTGNILKAANALISCNSDRMGKELWTAGSDGDLIALYAAFNELDEARFVVDKLTSLHEAGESYRDMAILYRSNAQSRVLEDALLQQNLPYRIYGGQRFFERAEIKDVLAYLRVLANVDDDAGLERIINWPTRGIGERTIEQLRDVARVSQISLWTAIQSAISEKSLSARALTALSQFSMLINGLREDMTETPLDDFVMQVMRETGLLAHYQKEKGEKGRARLENLDELINACRQFSDDTEESNVLTAFISHAVLEGGESQADEHQDAVQLMTLHTAKGLEFRSVFIVGLEDGLFPHQMSMNDDNRLEEERRLCYVGMTRAKQSLTLSYAESRRLHGTESYRAPSRFLRELPTELVAPVRMQTKAFSEQASQKKNTASWQSDALGDSGLCLGMRVMHPKFGEGTLVNAEGGGKHLRLQVNFDQAGCKWLISAYANLQAV